MTLIAEDVLLLLLDDVKGTASTGGSTDAVLGGAVLAELALLGLATEEEQKSRWRSGRVLATRPAPADLDPVLAEALATIAGKDRKASSLVTKIGKGLDDRLAAGLADRRILRRREGKRLGLIPRTTWPAADPSRDQQLRRTITVCLADGGRPDERTAALIGLLWAADEAHKAVAANTATTRRQLKKRAKEIAEGQWAAKAVKDAIAAAASSSGG
jgi:Golgi phosphoprotein 3 GPP34